MRRFLRRVSHGCAAAALLAAAPAAAAPGAYALVVGIDDYKSLPKLKGAVNDARLIERALKANGAREVVTLINGEATRERIVSAVKDLAAKASKDGGWLAITYAGHGGQETARLAGDEDDGSDEVLLLSSFLTGRNGNGERIPDNDVAELLSSLPRDLNILFLVDACHSGTMTRSADARATGLTYRNALYGAIEDDQLPPPPKATARLEAQQLPNVVFVASALDSEKTPEFEINGTKHGAVSWHFANALRGEADTNKDGTTTLAELRQYLVIAPRAMAQGRQTPGVYFRPGRDQEPFSLAPARAQAETTTIARRTLKLWTTGGSHSVAVPGSQSAASADDADLLWDRTLRQIVDLRTGDLIAQQQPGQDEQRFATGVVEKQVALAKLQELVAAAPMEVGIGPRGPGARYIRESVELKVPARPSAQLRFLTVFNIASDGTVQRLFPASVAEEGEIDPALVKTFSSNVSPPFGADHIVAVATNEKPEELRAMLAALNGQQAAAEAVAAVARSARAGSAAVGLAGLFTGED